MTIEITACGPGDEDALALVSRATFLQTYADTVPAADILAHCDRENSPERYAAWLRSPDYRFWAARASGTGAAVGFAMMCPPDLPVPTGPEDVELKRLYLLHRFHGGGAGWRLIQAVIDAARAAGKSRLLVGVYASNPDAIAFYARQGFTPAGVRQFRVGDNDYDDLVFALELDQA